MKVAIEIHPPPPMPVMTRAQIRGIFECAKPQAKFPIVKRLAAVQKLARRPKMSLNLPLSGCVAVRPIRYPDPSHEIIASESNSAAIVAERVEVMVLSAAARNVAIQVAIMPAMILGFMGLSELNSEWGSREVFSEGRSGRFRGSFCDIVGMGLLSV
jgi:hypothetical protein